MQNGYNESNPETGTLKVTFLDVTDFTIPENVNWDEISILEMKIDDDTLKLELINDITDDYLEIKIKVNEVSTETL